MINEKATAIEQGLSELQRKYEASKCQTFRDRIPLVDSLILQVQEGGNVLFLSDKELESINVGMEWEIESLESNVDIGEEWADEKLELAKSVKQKIERLME